MKKTFLYVNFLLKAIHKKAPAIPRFVDKKIYKNKAIFSPNFDCTQENIMQMLRIDVHA